MSRYKPLLPHIQPDPGNVNCPACRKYNIPGCSRCGFCNDHCHCSHCYTCNTSHKPNICPSCGACRRSGSCECKGKPKVLNLRQHLNGHLITQSQRVKVLSLQRTLGTEIEVSSYIETGTRTAFGQTQVRFVHDGSIRGANPTEMVCGPIPSHMLDTSLQAIGKWLRDRQAEVNTSCGLHVHVGATDLGAWELRRLLILMRVMEPTFFSLVAVDRIGTKYSRANTPAEWDLLLKCREATTSREIRRALLPAVYIGSDQRGAQRNKAQKYDQSRYRGFNLHSYFHRGTIEFRHHEGSVDISRIRSWMLWCGWFVEMASRLTDKEVDAIRRPEDFLHGMWKRQYGLISLPQEVVAYVQGGRTLTQPPPAPPPINAIPQVTTGEAMADAIARETARRGQARWTTTNAQQQATIINPEPPIPQEVEQQLRAQWAQQVQMRPATITTTRVLYDADAPQAHFYQPLTTQGRN